MAHSQAHELIGWAEPIARAVVETMREEHQPTLLMAKGTRRLEPVQLVAANAIDLEAQVRRYIAEAGATAACFINEAYMVNVETAPAKVIADVMANKVWPRTLPPMWQIEGLYLYAEDATGAWARSVWQITGRQPGGLVLLGRASDRLLSRHRLLSVQTSLYGMVAGQVKA